jgi:hypothetical protein
MHPRLSPLAIGATRWWKSRNLASTTYALLLVAFALAAIARLSESEFLTLVPLAISLGWVEVTGLCGTSHICALTPLRVMAPNQAWARAIVAYVCGGLATATLVGASVGAIGAFLPNSGSLLLFAASMTAAMLAAAHLIMPRINLPQFHRQTYKMWASEFGFVIAAAMWGAHIGLGVATVITFGGLYCILLASAALGAWQSTVLLPHSG